MWIRRRESKYPYTSSNAVTSAKAGSGRSSSRPTRGGAFNTTNRYGPCRPAGVAGTSRRRPGLRACAGAFEVHLAAGCGPACAAGSPAGRSSSCTWWRPREVGRKRQRERLQDRPRRRSRASAREHPIVAVIHGYRTSVLNAGSQGQAADPGVDGDLPRHVRQDRLPRELSEGREVDRDGRRRERVRRREMGAPPAVREDAQAARAPCVWRRVGVLRVVEAQLLQQRDVDRVRVGMEELRAEIDGDLRPW